MGVYRTAWFMVLGIVVPWLLQWLDKRRLPEEAQARAFNVASWGSALYAFSWLSMLGWAWRTRRPWWRVLVGAGMTGGSLALVLALDRFLQWCWLPAIEEPLTEVALMVGGFTLGALVFLLALEVAARLWQLARSRLSRR